MAKMDTRGFNAFIEEQKDTIFRTEPPEKSKFNVLLDEGLKKNLAADKYYCTIYRLQKYFDALVFLRGDNNNMYLQLCKEAEACKEPGNSPENTVVDSFAWAAIAYEKYKYKLYDEALILNRQSFTADEQLETQGFEMLYSHKIQLMHNLAKVLDRIEDPGCLMLLQGLMELLLCSKDLAFRDFNIPYRDVSAYTDIINILFTQICNELLGYNMRLRRKDAPAYKTSVQLLINILSGSGGSLIHYKKELAAFAEIMMLINTAEDLDKTRAGIRDFLLIQNSNLRVCKVFLLTHYQEVLSIHSNEQAAELKKVMGNIPSIKPLLF